MTLTRQSLALVRWRARSRYEIPVNLNEDYVAQQGDDEGVYDFPASHQAPRRKAPTICPSAPPAMTPEPKAAEVRRKEGEGKKEEKKRGEKKD
jgi:hypothetical protein